MSAVNSAAVSLMVLILLCSPTSGSARQSDTPSRGDHGVVGLRADSSIALTPLARLTRPSSVTPLAPWRRRLKSILEETKHEIGDEFDFGPVASPSQQSPSISGDFNSCRLPTAPPLRC